MPIRVLWDNKRLAIKNRRPSVHFSFQFDFLKSRVAFSESSTDSRQLPDNCTVYFEFYTSASRHFEFYKPKESKHKFETSIC